MSYIFSTFWGIIKTAGECFIIGIKNLGGALFDLKSIIGIIISGFFIIRTLEKLIRKW